MTGLWLLSYVALWVLLLIIAVVLLSILRNLGALYDILGKLNPTNEAPNKLVVGQALPDITLPTLDGDRKTLSSLHGMKIAISIIKPDCPPCQELIEALAKGYDHANDPTIEERVIVSVGEITETATLIRQASLPRTIAVLIDTQGDIEDHWGINATPTTVIVDNQSRFVRAIVGFTAQVPQHVEVVMGT